MGVPKTKAPKRSMVIISIHLPKEVLREIDELVKRGRYPSRAEFIRTAVQDLLDEMRYRQQLGQQQQQQQQDPPGPPEDPPVSPQPVEVKTKAEKERERSMRYKGCVEKLLNMLLANLSQFKFNVKQDGAYKIPKKIIVEFFTESCRMHKSVVAPAYNSLIKAFMSAGFSVAETPRAFILRKEPQIEVVVDA
jgi:Arc/MetJ-type ribon-helix-helix transcriptional regulator